MKGDTDEHGIIGKIVNRVNNFITTVETNVKGYLNGLVKFSEPFSNKMLINMTRFNLWDS